ncbi:MAG: hypothetical protein E5X53_26095 [Mesorhizobium sp.]|uniref:hypothetical protein n=1 Tax=Mesorhizobium sp. TaxID=1871066 RepID=UPI000FE99581|nr:hypothetical protein [Mesorhizobium sp.]RWG47946.1 MAG: hypothetical protein EOQ63_15315 [Mesorhizobium sp.]RWG55016.1 MAG: hypothetical protein EOQ65_28605 [Mesorhizobium sp.]TIR02323.1 MAG: hypothetical protein E5X32_27840 [Mesorhizobium sp.]TIR49107.1 MAG: hypothetical protein E5X53_26095 [Mesorhizobium sp.]
MQIRYISQEGPDFYVYKDSLGYDLEEIITYPGHVPIVRYPFPHFDRAAAIEARNWFLFRAKPKGIITPMF